MKNSKLKRIVALVLSAVMLLSFASCGDSTEETTTSYEVAESTTQAKTLAKAPQNDDSDEQTDERSDSLSNENLRYVMIYNPKIYDEYLDYDDSALSTGYLGNQINIDGYRGDSLVQDFPFYSISQKDIMKDLDINIKLENFRNDFISKVYNVGDVRNFYCFSENSMNIRVEKSFKCVYAGEHCHIWSEGKMDESVLQDYGKEFDKNIFNQVVEMFGEPRFAGKTGRINLIFAEMQENVGGCFFRGDVFATGEEDESWFKLNKFNTDHDILFINSLIASTEELQTYTYGTMAHEFQHLINMTNALSTYSFTICRTWLDETMSGYIEEALYPGTQYFSRRYESYNSSDYIRTGQSLYNFNNDGNDIGVYGSVYFFSEYLKNLAGDSVFSKIHNYWRTCYEAVFSEATAIMNSVSSSVKAEISNSVSYPDSWRFKTEEDEWLSKLVLDFYMSILSNKDEIDAFDDVVPEALLYDEINAADIEGGGRIVVAVNGTTFEIPDEADSGLIYVGLDEDFNAVTPFVFA